MKLHLSSSDKVCVVFFKNFSFFFKNFLNYYFRGWGVCAPFVPFAGADEVFLNCQNLSDVLLCVQGKGVL